MDDNRKGDKGEAGGVPESLDGGRFGPERRLYCRELIARFAHNLGLNWNIGEENTQSTEEVREMVKFIHDTDPYQHNFVIHLSPAGRLHGSGLVRCDRALQRELVQPARGRPYAFHARNRPGRNPSQAHRSRYERLAGRCSQMTTGGFPADWPKGTKEHERNQNRGLDFSTAASCRPLSFFAADLIHLFRPSIAEKNEKKAKEINEKGGWLTNERLSSSVASRG